MRRGAVKRTAREQSVKPDFTDVASPVLSYCNCLGILGGSSNGRFEHLATKSLILLRSILHRSTKTTSKNLANFAFCKIDFSILSPEQIAAHLKEHPAQNDNAPRPPADAEGMKTGSALSGAGKSGATE